MIDPKIKFLIRIITMAVVLIFSVNITAADHVYAQILTKSERLESEIVSAVAYDARTLVRKEAGAAATIVLKNELLKYSQPVNPAAKSIAMYDQESRYAGLFSDSIESRLPKDKEYEPVSGEKTDNIKDRSPLVLLPGRGTSWDAPIGDNMEKTGEVDGRPIYRIIENDDPEPPSQPEDRPLTDEEKQRIADAENFINDLAKAFFDTDGDGTLDDADKYDYEPGGKLDIDIGGIPISEETYDLLKKIFVKLVWYNKSDHLDIDGIQIDIVTASPDGSLSDGIKITISDGSWKIIFNYTPPPGVDTGTPRTIKITFENLQNARKRIAGEIDAAEEAKSAGQNKNAGAAIIGPTEGSHPESATSPESPAVTTGSAKRTVNPGISRKGPFNKPANIANGRPRTSKKNAANIDAATTTRDGYKLLRTEWRSEKSALDKVIERVLAEEPGAVYTNADDTINAIILLKAKCNSDDKEDKDSEEDDNKSS